jgi:hypothetical protein
MSANSYHKMSLAKKQAHALAQLREPSVACPVCDTQLPPVDLLRHFGSTCAGPRAPHPASAWLTWREALKLGVPRGTLSRWAARGIVRTQGEKMDRRYLLRDVTKALSRRKFHKWNRLDGAEKP